MEPGTSTRAGLATLILNPSSGGGHTADELRGVLERAGIFVGSVVDGGRSPWESARSAINAGAQMLIAAGGDGTVSAVAAAVVDSEATLGVLPVGTLNHFARDLGIPLGLDAAAAVIAAGKTAQVDVGEVNGRAFVNNSSLGVYPRLVLSRREQQRVGRGKWMALLWAMFSALRHMPRLRVRVIAGGTQLARKTPLVFIANNEYALEGLNAGTRACLDSGRLFIHVVNARSALQLIRLSVRVLLGRAREGEEFETISVTEAWIETRRKRAKVSLDGEVVRMATPLHYRTRPRALRVLVP